MSWAEAIESAVAVFGDWLDADDDGRIEIEDALERASGLDAGTAGAILGGMAASRAGVSPAAGATAGAALAEGAEAVIEGMLEAVGGGGNGGQGSLVFDGPSAGSGVRAEDGAQAAAAELASEDPATVVLGGTIAHYLDAIAYHYGHARDRAAFNKSMLSAAVNESWDDAGVHMTALVSSGQIGTGMFASTADVKYSAVAGKFAAWFRSAVGSLSESEIPQFLAGMCAAWDSSTGRRVMK